MNRDDNLKYLIKSIYRLKKNAIQIKRVKGEIKFSIDYNLAKKYAASVGQSYYFDTELNYKDFKEYLRVFKELLKVKRFLKNL